MSKISPRSKRYSILLPVLLAAALCGQSIAAPTLGISPEAKGYLGVYKQSAYAYLQQGSQLADNGLYDKAVPYLRQAVDKNPTNILAQYNLGYSLMMAAEETVSPEKKQAMLEEAEWAFRRAKDLNPDLTLTYFKLGKLALDRNDVEAARDCYKDGVANHPDNFALVFNLAAAYEKLNDLPHAEEAYAKAIALNPKFVFAHNNLGLLYEQTNRPEKAEAVYRDALKAVPDYNFARLNLGSLLQGQGRLTEAETMYKEALQYEPENAWAYLYLGNTYYRMGNYSKALEAYKHAVVIDPKYPTTYYLISLVLQKLNRNDEAIASGLQYIHLSPDGAFSQEANELVLTLQQAKEQASEKP